MRAALLRFLLRTLTAGFFLATAGLLWSQFAQTRAWNTAIGTMDFAFVERAGDPDDSRAPGERFQISASYTYSVGDQEYEGSRLGVFPWVFAREDHAMAYLARNEVPLRGRVMVYVDAADPTSSVLVRGIPWRRVEVWLAALFLIVLPVAVVFFSLVDLVRGGASRGNDRSRGRFW